jgi:hypothetical protein
MRHAPRRERGEAAQSFASADEAGDLATSTGALAVNLDLVDPGRATLSPLFDALFADLGAQLFSDFGLPDMFLY